MNTDNKHIIDNIFSHGLDNYEVEYSNGAWENMQQLMDKDKKRLPLFLLTILSFIQKQKIILLTMSIFTIISTATVSLFMSGNNDFSANGEKSSTHEVKSFKAARKVNSTNTETTAHPTAVFEKISNTEPTSADTNKQTAIGVDFPFIAQDIKPFYSSLQSQHKGNMYSKYKVAGIQKWEKYSVFRAPWLGIHFAMQNPLTNELKDSNRQNAGFTIQLMSSNLIQKSDYGIYLGGEFGMQFLGRGPKKQVVINTVHQDSGYTRLNSLSMDFFMRGHFEYSRFFIKPYINLVAGPRLYTTGQHTESYMKLTDYESSDQSNVHTAVSLMVGAAIGARVRVSPMVSLDTRFEFMQGTAVNLVNLDKSEFNGLSYTLSKFNVTPQYTQFKVGILFELSDNSPREERKYSNQNQSEVSSITTKNTNIYYDSTLKQFIECNCTCIKTPLGEKQDKAENDGSTSLDQSVKTNNSARDLDPSNDSKGNTMTPVISGGSGRGGKGKQAFPGIKPSASPVKIKH